MLVVTFLGVVAGMTLRTASAFKEVQSGWTFMASLAIGFSVGRALVSFVSSKAANKYGSKVTALGFLALAFIGLAYALGPVELYPLLRVLHGFSSGITWPSMQSVVMGTASKEERAKVSSLYFFIGTIGMSFAYLIGGVLSRESLLVFPLILIGLSIYLFRESIKIELSKIKSEKGLFNPPSSTLFLMAMATGMLNLLVNSEVTISLLYLMFGKIMAGIFLSLASAIGSVVSYFLGRKMLDLKQSPASIVVPATASIASSQPLLIVHDPYAKVASIALTQGTITWWRGLLVAAARSGDVGARIGLVNMGRDLGNVIAGLIVSAIGQPGFAFALGVSYVVTTLSMVPLLSLKRSNNSRSSYINLQDA